MRFQGVAPEPRQRPAPRAVLFDLDGTLVRTPIDFAAMRRESLAAAARYGAAVDDLEGRDILAISAVAASRVRDAAAFLEEIEALLQRIELEASCHAVPMPGAPELLAWLAENDLGIGIVTRNCAAAAREALERSGLACELLLTRADVPRVKPDPLHLQIAAEQLGVPPEETLMVGDHPMDVAAGRAAGMRTAGFAPTEAARERLAAEGPDLLVSDLLELRAWISPSSS